MKSPDYQRLGKAISYHESALSQARASCFRVLGCYWEPTAEDKYYDQSWDVWQRMCEFQNAIESIAEGRVRIGEPGYFVI